MKFLGSFLILAFIFAAGLAQGGVRDPLYPSGTWRYRMTATIETPEGLKSGSAVREISAHTEPKLFSEQGGGYATLSKGEAVVVDLGKRGLLFAVIKGGNTPDYGYRVFFDAFPFKGALTPKGIEYYCSLKSGKAVLQPAQYPVFVRFKDLKNPRTVDGIYQTDFFDSRNASGRIEKKFRVKTDRFEEVFGKGVRIKEVTIEITTEPVTVGIEKYLPWLPSRKNVPGFIGGSSGPRFDDPTGTHLRGSHFSVGRFW